MDAKIQTYRAQYIYQDIQSDKQAYTRHYRHYSQIFVICLQALRKAASNLAGGAYSSRMTQFAQIAGAPKYLDVTPKLPWLPLPPKLKQNNLVDSRPRCFPTYPNKVRKLINKFVVLNKIFTTIHLNSTTWTLYMLTSPIS